MLNEAGKRGMKKLATIATIAVALILLVVYWTPITSKFSVLTKRVGEMKTLKQSELKDDQNVNAEVRETANYKVPFVELPTTRRVASPRIVLNHVGIMWNATAAFVGANGGEYTKQGSQFDILGKEYGTSFCIKAGRQDDYSAQQDQLAVFTKEYLSSDGKVTDKGAALVSLMGDNAEIYMQQLNKKIDAVAKELKFKPGEIHAEGFLLAGYSWGEDKAMGLQEWKDDPRKALGQVFACYPQDGDQNLIIKWATDNGLLINPDGETYCADAINFQFTDGFMEAAAAWGTMTGERVVVKIDPKTGLTKKTGEKKSMKVLGVGSWTPGDEKAYNAAKSEGVDLVSLYSTKDNAHQMPCLFVTLNKFAADHPEVIDAIVEGTVRFGDQMKVHDKAFEFGMQCMSEVFTAQPKSYWSKYFGGVKVKTPNGFDVVLGGTRVCNLADNMDALGVGENARNTFQSSYELFGGFMHQLYPEYMPNRLSYSKAINRSSVERVAEKMGRTNEITQGNKPKFVAGPIKDKVAERSYSVTFMVGSAELTSSGVQAMESMFKDLNTNDLSLAVSGHTDNTGSDAVNIPLSQRRAQTVVNWLKHKNPASFPNGRFVEVKGYGSTRPLSGTNPDTPEGQSMNRRVEVTQGRTN